jgi:hypothetical protein
MSDPSAVSLAVPSEDPKKKKVEKKEGKEDGKSKEDSKKDEDLVCFYLLLQLCVYAHLYVPVRRRFTAAERAADAYREIKSLSAHA